MTIGRLISGAIPDEAWAASAAVPQLKEAERGEKRLHDQRILSPPYNDPGPGALS